MKARGCANRHKGDALDKYEYKLKLDEIEALAGEKNYAEAARLADGINWRKVHNVSALMLAGEVYQQTGRYEDARELLLLAYERSPIGKKIIYRLAEIAIEAKQFDEAQEYYDEFVEIAPHDTLKYVLRYRMSQAKGEPYDAQIAILEELKEQEYTEEWAFELAYLYHLAGRNDKCIEACDELILWFGDGPYVEKALELKMLYQPLSAEQEEKYKQFRRKRDGIIEVRPDEYLQSGEIVNNTISIPEVHYEADRFSTQNLQEELAKGMQQIMEATEKETVNDTMDSIKKMVEDIPYLQPLLAEEQGTAPLPLPDEYETDEEIDSTINTNFQEILGVEYDGQMSISLRASAEREPQVNGQMTIEDVLAEWEKTKRAAEAAMDDARQRKLESAKARALQEAGELMDRLAVVIPQLLAGATTKELVEQAYEDSPDSIERASRALADANEKLQEEIDRLQADEAVHAPDEQAHARMPVQDDQKTPSRADSHPQAAEADTGTGIDESPDGAAVSESWGDEGDGAPHDRQRYGSRQGFGRADEEPPARTFPDLSSILSTDVFHAEKQRPPMDAADPADEPDDAPPDYSEEPAGDFARADEDAAGDDGQSAGVNDDSGVQDEEDGIMQAISDWEAMKDPTTPLPEISMDIFDESDEQPAPDPAASFQGIKKMDAEMVRRFSYFAKVDGMEDQICRAVTTCGAYLAGISKGAYGNLAIIGASGCGKTMLATNIVKTLQQLIGKPLSQIGKINGEALNRKDVAALMGKIGSGCLIIEHVGDLSRETEKKLSEHIERHAGESLIILEGDRDGMAQAMGRHEGFAGKFGARIEIPFFSNDELVEFARTYAAENGYDIDAMATLALYKRISNIQKIDQATTLVEVKEIVDEAIARVEKGSLKKMFGILTSKRYDENNYVLLHEKDFEG